MWLTAAQLERLTGRKRPSAQIEVLRESGIAFTVVNGKPIVMPESLIPRQSNGPRLRLTA